MTDELGDAFDQVSESDEATDAVFRQAQSLDDTKRYAEGLFHEGALYSSPVVQGETDAARAVWQKAEKMSGGDVYGKAADGLDHVMHDDPAALWDEIQPDNLGPYAEPGVDLVGTSAIESVQMGADIIDSMNPASNWKPAAQLVRDEWQEAKNVDLDKIPWKDPEIPDTDAVGADIASDAVPLAPAADVIVASDADTAGPDPSTSYDAPASYDTPSYDTPSYDTSGYDTGSSGSGGASGAVDGDDTGSSFTDGF